MSQTLRWDTSRGPTSPPVADVYAFGPIRVDVARHAVTRDGSPVPLAPKTFELLLILLRSGGRVLTRQELVSALWPDTFVEEANLSFQISTLRKALGNGAEEWIATVPRLGYRFVPDVAVDADTLPTSVSEPPVPPRGPTQRTRRAPLWVALLLAMAVVGSLTLMWSLREPPLPRYDSRPTPLTMYPGLEGVPSLSPDGSMVAFAWSGPTGGPPAIYVRPVAGGEPLRLTGRDASASASPRPVSDVNATWSPDGSQIAFLRFSTGSPTTDLMVVPALGGVERRIFTGDVHTPYDDPPSTNLVSWTPDSRWVAVGASRTEPRGIWLVDIDGGPPRRLTTPPDGQQDRSPAFSADGRRMTLVRQSALGRDVLFIVSLDDAMNAGDPRPIVDAAPLHIVSADWDPSARAVLYSVGAFMGPSTLRRLRLRRDRLTPAGPSEPLGVGEQARGLDVAASGRLVYVRRLRDTGFRALDLLEPDRGWLDTLLPASTADESTPHYNPDGSRLAFASTRSGSQEIWIANADGSQAHQATRMGGPVCANPQWSPDGTRIAFSSTAAGSFDLYELDPHTHAVRRLTDDEGTEDHPRWSRDGRWIYFKGSADRAGQTNLWKIPASGGPRVAVTTDGGAVAEESPDCTMLFYTRLDKGRAGLWRRLVAGGAPTRVADGLALNVNFAVGARAVYAVVNGARPGLPEIHAIEHGTLRRTLLWRIGRPAWAGVTLSPDERRLIVTVFDSREADLMLVDPAR